MSDRQLVFIRILFISVIYALGYITAIIIYAFPLKKRDKFALRAIVSGAACLAFSVGIAVLIYSAFMAIYDWMWYGGYNMIVYTCMMTVLQIFYLFLSYALLPVLFSCGGMQILYCVIAGYATWRAGMSIYSILISLAGFNSAFALSAVSFLSLAADIGIFLVIEACVYIVFALIFAKKFGMITNDYDQRLNSYTLFLCMAVVVISLICGCISEIFQNESKALG